MLLQALIHLLCVLALAALGLSWASPSPQFVSAIISQYLPLWLTLGALVSVEPLIEILQVVSRSTPPQASVLANPSPHTSLPRHARRTPFWRLFFSPAGVIWFVSLFSGLSQVAWRLLQPALPLRPQDLWGTFSVGLLAGAIVGGTVVLSYTSLLSYFRRFGVPGFLKLSGVAAGLLAIRLFSLFGMSVILFVQHGTVIFLVGLTLLVFLALAFLIGGSDRAPTPAHRQLRRESVAFGLATVVVSVAKFWVGVRLE